MTPTAVHFGGFHEALEKTSNTTSEIQTDEDMKDYDINLDEEIQQVPKDGH